MLLGRMLHFYLPEGRKTIMGVKPQRLATYFVCFDILSFIIQGAGVSNLSPTASTDTIQLGFNIYMGGIGAQQLFIALFVCIVVTFHRRMVVLGQTGLVTHTRKGWRRLTATLYAVLILITVRPLLPVHPFD